ncbi:hypothetical protein GJ496_004240 [Pomphorhynchus laevis]|nr:hypothetical protein GJ496_004240 [Pomphorhynchus laevis]
MSDNNEVSIQLVSEFTKPPITSIADARIPDYVSKLLKSNFEVSSLEGTAWSIMLSGQNMLAVIDRTIRNPMMLILPIIVHVKEQISTLPGHISSPICIVLCKHAYILESIYNDMKIFADKLNISTSKIVTTSRGRHRMKHEGGISEESHILLATSSAFKKFYVKHASSCLLTSLIVLYGIDDMIEHTETIKTMVSQYQLPKQIAMISYTNGIVIRELATNLSEMCLFVPADSWQNYIKFIAKSTENIRLMGKSSNHTVIFSKQSDFNNNRAKDIIKRFSRMDARMIIFVKRLNRMLIYADRFKQQLPNLKVFTLNHSTSLDSQKKLVEEFCAVKPSLLLTPNLHHAFTAKPCVQIIINLDTPRDANTHLNHLKWMDMSCSWSESFTFISYPFSNHAAAIKLYRVLVGCNLSIPDKLMKYVAMLKASGALTIPIIDNIDYEYEILKGQRRRDNSVEMKDKPAFVGSNDIRYCNNNNEFQLPVLRNRERMEPFYDNRKSTDNSYFSYKLNRPNLLDDYAELSFANPLTIQDYAPQLPLQSFDHHRKQRAPRAFDQTGTIKDTRMISNASEKYPKYYRNLTSRHHHIDTNPREIQLDKFHSKTCDTKKTRHQTYLGDIDRQALRQYDHANFDCFNQTRHNSDYYALHRRGTDNFNSMAELPVDKIPPNFFYETSSDRKRRYPNMINESLQILPPLEEGPLFNDHEAKIIDIRVKDYNHGR